MSDTQMIEERLRGYLAAPDDADWQDVLRRVGEAPTRAAPFFTRRRMALALAACIAVAAPAVVLSGALTSSRSAQQHQATIAPRGARPMGYEPIKLDFTRSGQQITSINLTANAPIRDATLQLQVLRTNDRSCPACSDAERQVVFQEQVPMTNIASPAEGPQGVVALSTWSGTLSPSNWDGGCQNAFYTVAFESGPSGSPLADGSQSGNSAYFLCSSG
jgi:hypothetical protein